MRTQRIVLTMLMAVSILVLLAGCTSAVRPVPDASEGQQEQLLQPPPSEEIPTEEKDIEPPAIRVPDLLHTVQAMSLNEKIGQMVFAGISGTEITDEMKNLINEYKVGGIIVYASNLSSYEQSLELINAIKEVNATTPYPLFLGVDQEGGAVSRLPGLAKLPTNAQIGNRNDPELSNDIGTILAKQLQAFGLNINFAPVLDVHSNPHNPVIGNRAFSADPHIVRSLGIATMQGMQNEGVIPVVKHFPGHGDTAVDSHFELPVIQKNSSELHEMELVPFQAAIDQGADVVMIAHILLPLLDGQHPATLSKAIITDLLRDEMKFDGVVITDDMTMQAITNHHTVGDAAVASILAGTDIVMIAHGFANATATIEAILTAVQSGELTEQRIDESVHRILALKQKYELRDTASKKQSLEALHEQIKIVNDKVK